MDSPLREARVVGGRYRLLTPLGSGGMGTVWRAEDTVLGRHVAVKEVVFPHGLSDDDRATLRERTRREARAAARLDHPSAVTVYDVVEQDGQPWLVLELVEARTLAEVVREDGPLGPQRVAQVGLAVLGALEAAHRRGIVHRDVKPSNVLLGQHRVVLTDFGIATSAGDPSITSTGLLLGSPSYISPERARGGPPAPASDLWSLGATLFTAVEGRPPYDKGEPLPTLTAVVTDDREPYVAAGPLVPLLDALLQPDPQARADAAAARRLLQEVANQTAALPAPPPSPSPDAERRAEQTSALPLPPAPRTAGPAPTPRTAGPAHAAAPGAAPAAAPVSSVPPRRVPPPAPAAAPRRRSAGALAAGALGLVLLGAAGYGLSTLQTDEPDGPSGSVVEAQDGTAQDGSAQDGSAQDGSQDGTDSDGTGSAAVEPPEGWQTVSGGPGWTAAVPADWRATEYRNGTQFRDPETARTLRVTTGAGTDRAVQDRQEQAADFARRHPTYQEIRIEPVDYRGHPAADWEFTYTDGGADLHVVNRVVNVDGTGHSLFFQVRASDWPAAREDFEQIVASFRPAGT